MGPITALKAATLYLDPKALIQSGHKGADVSQVQKLLNANGAGLTVDGDFGSKTEDAVRQFQMQHGLKADGVVGPKTLEKLLNGSSASAAPAAHASGPALDLNRELASPDSRLSVAIGVAEGTRTPDGARTAAYTQHTDPGNGKTNVGTFSYQHGAASPAQADRQQLQEFKRVQPQYENACRKAGLDPSNPLLAATFFDLYNQAPAAAMNKGGLLDQLPSLARKGVTAENLAQARYQSFYDPDKGAFDTNLSLPDLKADQQRRTDCLVQVVGRGEAKATTPTAPQPGKIGFNSEGPEVAKLKQSLKDAGFYNGPINEKMGQQGLDALIAAKTALKIGGPLDVAGPETIQKIAEYAKSLPSLHVDVDFVSQFGGTVPGDYPEQAEGLRCDNACDYMMSNTSNHAHRVIPGKYDSDVYAFGGGGRADAKVKYIEAQLRGGKPVMIGINHPLGTQGTGNPFGINHYLVATGMGVDDKGRQYISFNDPAKTDAALGKDTNPANRLYLQNGRFVSDNAADPFDLRGVVANQGSKP